MFKWHQTENITIVIIIIDSSNIGSRWSSFPGGASAKATELYLVKIHHNRWRYEYCLQQLWMGTTIFKDIQTEEKVKE